MGLLSTTITSVCIAITDPNEQQACLNGLTALSKENNTDKMFDSTENEFNKYLLKDANDVFTNNGTVWIGGSLYIVKVIHDRRVSFNLPTFGVCDSLSNAIGPDSYLIRLEWRL